MSFLTYIFGNKNQRFLKKYQNVVNKINNLEKEMQILSDTDLKKKTLFFKQIINNGCSLNKILPEVFAVCREASKRVLKMRHFDVQIMGGIALHLGKISEMGTGEGKTLMSTLPAYLNALSGKGVHIITVNNYLASRDFEWMGVLYKWLGLNVGINLPYLNTKLKHQSYMSDITYGTNNEFGFDYLKDNMIFYNKNRVQRNLNFAIIDEIDSILIDEARIPLIISGQIENNTDIFLKINIIPKKLLIFEVNENFDIYQKDYLSKKYDLIKNIKNNQIILTELGYKKVENILISIGILNNASSLYEVSNLFIMYYVYASLKAHILYYKNKHYVVQNGLVIIIDEYTGRLIPDRRWSDGLHQAIEVKEGVKIQNENQTLASITFQSYFKMYKKLSGMTGTAYTEAYEFKSIYNLETIVIPHNKNNIRIDYQDQIYKSSKEKYKAILKDIYCCYNIGRPVLIGTTSIKNSEFISNILSNEKLPHSVLNAKHHMYEIEIISQAGKPKMITIATNMVGRGTDIILGGDFKKQIKNIKDNNNLSNIQKKRLFKKINNYWKILNKIVIDSGGLHVICSERHELRRIDNQFSGRSGRQGDPGSSCFYLSLDDPLLCIFLGNYVKNILNKFNYFNHKPIKSKIITKSIRLAQKKIGFYNFKLRKYLLKYDKINSFQRKIIYKERSFILKNFNILNIIFYMSKNIFLKIFKLYVPKNSLYKKWNLLSIDNILNILKINFSLQDIFNKNTSLSSLDLLDIFLFKIKYILNQKIKYLGLSNFNELSRYIILINIDFFWKEHLFILDSIKESIYLREYIQKSPIQEYKKESFKLFNKMLELIKKEVIKFILTTKLDKYLGLNKKNLLKKVNYEFLLGKYLKKNIF